MFTSGKRVFGVFVFSIVTKRTTKKFICVNKKYGKEVEENYRNRNKDKRWEEERGQEKTRRNRR